MEKDIEFEGKGKHEKLLYFKDEMKRGGERDLEEVEKRPIRVCMHARSLALSLFLF